MNRCNLADSRGLPCRGRSQDTFTPAISTLPQASESSQLIDMDSRVAGLVSTLRSAGGQVQALHLTGLPGTGDTPAPMPIWTICTLGSNHSSDVYVQRD